MSRAVAWVERYGSSGPLRAEQPATKAASVSASCWISSGESGLGSWADQVRVEIVHAVHRDRATGAARIPRHDVEPVAQHVGEVEAGLLRQDGPGHTGATRVDEERADALVRLPGRTALDVEVDGPLRGVGVVEEHRQACRTRDPPRTPPRPPMAAACRGPWSWWRPPWSSGRRSRAGERSWWWLRRRQWCRSPAGGGSAPGGSGPAHAATTPQAGHEEDRDSAHVHRCYGHAAPSAPGRAGGKPEAAP